MALLGIDLGTSAVKVLVLDTQGRSLGVGKVGYEVMSPHPGWAEGDPNAWWRATVSAVQAAMAQAPHARITTIGLSGQMHGVVPTDKGRRPTRAALLWADTRAEEELKHYQALPPALLGQLANPLVPGMAGPLLCWLADHEPEAYQVTRWALQPKDWLRLCLTDSVASDPSDASATLLYDLPADHWADDVITALGLRRDLFQERPEHRDIAAECASVVAFRRATDRRKRRLIHEFRRGNASSGSFGEVEQLASLLRCPYSICIACSHAGSERSHNLAIHRMSKINHAVPFFPRQHAIEPCRRVARRWIIGVVEVNAVCPSAADSDICRTQGRRQLAQEFVVRGAAQHLDLLVVHQEPHRHLALHVLAGVVLALAGHVDAVLAGRVRLGECAALLAAAAGRGH